MLKHKLVKSTTTIVFGTHVHNLIGGQLFILMYYYMEERGFPNLVVSLIFVSLVYVCILELR